MSPEKEKELRRAITDARTAFNRLPSPSDDPDAQTAVASAYRHTLVTIQLLAAPILAHPIREQLVDLSVDTATIHGVYDVMPKLNALLFDIDEALSKQHLENALTKSEIDRLVRQWIGVDGGYLGYPASLRFTYASHDEFWMHTCGVIADTYGFPGTTRECFIDTLSHASPSQQADVLDAILKRFPVVDPPEPDSPNLRRPNLETIIKGWIDRLRSAHRPRVPSVLSAADDVRTALEDADKLGPLRSVDRLHTAMHGYLHQLCIDAGITVEAPEPTMARLLKALRQGHPALADGAGGAEHVSKVLQGMAQILDVLNPIRNRHSAAHPRNELLGEPEAELVCDTVRVLLRYLESRLRST